MTKNTLTAVLAVIGLVLLAAAAFLVWNEDTELPVIAFTEDVPSYSEGAQPETLLKNVSAYDTVDGDLTASVRVLSVKTSEDGLTAEVEYAVCDSSNNIRCAAQTIPVGEAVTTPAPESQEAQQTAGTEAAAASEAAPAETAGTPVPESGAAESVSSFSGEESAETENTAESEANPPADPAAPVIALSRSEVEIGVSENFSFMAYIESMTDDKDSYDTLAGRVEINGDFRTKRAGSYTLTYFVRDTDGNISNQETLTLVRR